MLFSHTNTIFEITMTTFAVSFAVNEQNGRRMERLNQALGPIESTRHLVFYRVPPSAVPNILREPLSTSSKATSGLRCFHRALCTATVQQRGYTNVWQPFDESKNSKCSARHSLQRRASDCFGWYSSSSESGSVQDIIRHSQRLHVAVGCH